MTPRITPSGEHPTCSNSPRTPRPPPPLRPNPSSISSDCSNKSKKKRTASTRKRMRNFEAKARATTRDSVDEREARGLSRVRSRQQVSYSV